MKSPNIALLNKVLINPFIIYVIIVALTLLLYQLGWSSIYPPISSYLVTFFGVTCALAVLLAFFIHKKITRIRSYQPGQLPKYTIFFLLPCFIADFVYTGFVPFISMMGGELFIYHRALFEGVPSLHVFTVTFSSAFSTIRFADFLHSRKKVYLLEAIIPLVFFLLIIYRGPIFIVLVSWVFAYTAWRSTLTWKELIAVCALAISALYAFGVLGDLREKGTVGIYGLGKPSERFYKTHIPKQFFWAYIYITSPTANFQETSHTKINQKQVTSFIINEMHPDFISKRMNQFIKTNQVHPAQVANGLSVNGMFSKSFLYLGHAGPFIMFLWLSLIIYTYIMIIAKTTYFIPCVSLLCTLVTFSFFINTIAYSAISLQLIWPILFFNKYIRTQLANVFSTKKNKRKYQ
ncbi:MAG: hypothetical protein KTR20_02805 [Cellvibrionaceae bacterium]|nr:hypothetical protein [Cellvibrionaceae bacterium]